MQSVHERGFTTAGLREITARAGVAQGSFTNHFASKEEFGVAILDHYFQQIEAVIQQTLLDATRSPLNRIRAYFSAITELLAAAEWRYGCLAGNMSLEAAEHSESIRLCLVDIFARWTAPFASALRAAQSAGEIAPGLQADDTAAALLEAWHGAMLRMKIERSPAPLERFQRLTLPALLAESAPTRHQGIEEIS